MAVTSKKILDANVSTCAVAGTAEEVSSFIESVGDKLDKSGGDPNASISWDADGMTIKINASVVIDENGSFAGLYIGGTDSSHEVKNIGDIRREIEGYSWDWSAIYNTPTTVDGYGITDASKTSDFSPSTPANYVTNFVQKCATILAPNFSESTSYAVGNFCTRMDGASPKIYQCTTAHTGAWNAAHFAERDVSALFSSDNTALVSAINNIIGVPNALLEAALSGEEVS